MGSVGVHVPAACHAYTEPIACSGSEPGVQGRGEAELERVKHDITSSGL